VNTGASLIDGSDKLTSIFGRWPSFHDSEVVSLAFDRAGPTITANIHVFEMTSEISSTGHYICRKHCVATLRFLQVDEIECEGFNHQNALMGLVINDGSHRQKERIKFEVSLDGAYGVDLSFACSGIEVHDVTPGIPGGSVYADYSCSQGN
jgi:Immunity protein 50